jgi:hypothetical protein
LIAIFYDLENPIGFAADINFEQSCVPLMLLSGSLRKLRRSMEPDYFLVLPWLFAADHPTLKPRLGRAAA